MKKIMILGASILQLPAIEKALQMGLQVIAVDMNPDAIGFKVKDVIPEIISTIDAKYVVEAARKHHIDGIMTLASDMPIRTVATVAKELKLTGISEDTALKATNKVEMRKSLYENNVPIPHFYKVSNKTEYQYAINNLDFPIIVKPADNSGSRGISKLDNSINKENLDKAYQYSKEYSRNGDVIVEEFMEGFEVSVETFSLNGICNIVQITDKITTGSPHFVEIGHTQPTRLPYKITEQIKNIAVAANKAIGILNGPSHTEIIVTKDGPKIVELGARLGGDCIATHLVPLSTGVDMVECSIRLALGEIPNIALREPKGSAIRYLSQTPGLIKQIDGIDVAMKMPGIKKVSIIHGVDEILGKLDSSNARMGFIIAQGLSADDAEKKCNSALNKISIKIGEKK